LRSKNQGGEIMAIKTILFYISRVFGLPFIFLQGSWWGAPLIITIWITSTWAMYQQQILLLPFCSYVLISYLLIHIFIGIYIASVLKINTWKKKKWLIKNANYTRKELKDFEAYKLHGT